jgi:hypothetical protein
MKNGFDIDRLGDNVSDMGTDAESIREDLVAFGIDVDELDEAVWAVVEYNNQ